jgi:predicted enzyme related to lactoylglutathione lyase
MLGSARTATILPVTDYERASEFYSKQLGLSPAGEAPDGQRLFSVGGGDFISLRQMPAGTQSSNTVMSFEVDDIGSEIKDLEAHGVTFQDLDGPDLKTIDHIAYMGAEMAAWFTDPDGNVLCLHQASPGQQPGSR